MTQATKPVPDSIAPAREEDEISLRDLYLIFKKGLLFILAAALLAGLATYLYFSAQDPVYEAESTTVITPPPVSGVQGRENISFTQSVLVTFESYQTLAFSRPVLEATAAQFPEGDVSAGGLRGAGRLEQLIGPQRPGEVAPLSVSHLVRHTDPAMSAALTNAWTEATLETIRNSLLAGLNPVDAATSGELHILEARLAEVENAWRAFGEEDEGGILSARLEGLTVQFTTGEARLNELARELAVAEARHDVLASQLEEELTRTTSSDPTSDAFLAGLSLTEAHDYVSRQAAAAARQRQEARQALDGFDRANLLPLLRAELRSLTGESAADALRDRPFPLRATSSSPAEDSSVSNQRTEIITVVEAPTDTSGSLPALQARLRSLPRELAQLEAGQRVEGADEAALETRLAALREEAALLPGEIAAAAARVGELQEAVVGLESERETLRLNAAVADELYAVALLRAQQLAYGEDDPRQAERVLRDSAPEVRALQSLLREQEAQHAGLRAERDSLSAQLEQYRGEADTTRRQLAGLTMERSQLERNLENTRSAYQEIIRLQPTVSFVTQLAPLSARILSEASVPDAPVGPRRTFNTALAVIFAGVLATLFVFLREAVSSPSAPTRPRPGAAGARPAGATND